MFFPLVFSKIVALHDLKTSQAYTNLVISQEMIHQVNTICAFTENELSSGLMFERMMKVMYVQHTKNEKCVLKVLSGGERILFFSFMSYLVNRT